MCWAKIQPVPIDKRSQDCFMNPQVAPSSTGALTGDFLSQSLWQQSDRLMAQALLRSILFCSNIGVQVANRRGAPKVAMEQLEGDALLLRQIIAEAAALRDIRSFGVPGEVCKFDPAMHELAAGVVGRRRSPPKFVTIIHPGIAKAILPCEAALIRALVMAGKSPSEKTR